MKVAISVQTSADLSKELIAKYDIKVIPFTIHLGEKTYADGEITSEEIIEYVNKNKVLPKTSAINEFQYTEHFEELLKEYDAVVHFSISSKLSSAYENAVKASQKYSNVYVLDTFSLSTGIALLALYGAQLRDEGKNANEIYQSCKKRVNALQVSFELQRVDYLYKGGRCSVLALLGANVFRIRPQILVVDGKMISGKKFKGNYNKVVEEYCNDILQRFNTPDLSTAFITYTTAPQEVLDIAYNHLKQAGFKQIYFTRAGGTITSHCGEDCLGILYLNDGDKI